MDADPATAADRPAPWRRRRWPVAVLTVALVAALGVLVVQRTQLFDPYRPGTSHRVTVTMNGCLRPGPLYLDGRTWDSREQPPAHWPNTWRDTGTPGTNRIEGTLDVDDTDLGRFTADIGGTVTYHRLRAGAFASLECPLA